MNPSPSALFTLNRSIQYPEPLGMFDAEHCRNTKYRDEMALAGSDHYFFVCAAIIKPAPTTTTTILRA